METTTLADANAATDASLAARATDAANVPTPTPTPPTAAKRAAKIARAPRPAAKTPTAAKTPKRPATPVVPTSGSVGTRRALSPAERAKRPVTANVAAYLAYLESATVLGRKLSGPERFAAGISITLYGGYQKEKNDDLRARGLK